MIQIHLKKYYKNYLFFLFIVLSYLISLLYSKKGMTIYYLVAISIFILGFSKTTFFKDLGLSFKIFLNKKIYSYLIPSIIISNVILFAITKYIMNDPNSAKESENILLLSLFFISLNSIRTFGEEFIFRGFLLIKDIKNNNLLFWILNIVQALLFSLIHSLFVDDLLSKFIFGSYVLVLSIYFGWLNRKFNSLFLSWVIHWINGIQTLIIAFLI